jgi:hypothetical protein
MKLLLLTTYDYDQIQLENCKKQYDIYFYFINHYIKLNFKDIEIIIHKLYDQGRSSRIVQQYKNVKYPKCDHCLIINNRGVSKRPSIFFDRLRESISGCIATISANNCYVGNEDVLFYQMPSGKSRKYKCRLINWACDEKYCIPKQNINELNILIDHPYYGRGSMKLKDKTLEISEKIWNWSQTVQTNKKIIIKRFCNGGIEILNKDNYNKLDNYKQNNGLTFDKACDIYNRTDIFFVTHHECMGLVVLECAMSGALIVSPNTYIKRELLKNVYHKICDTLEDEQLDNCLKLIDHQKALNRVHSFTWQNSTNIIMDTFINWNKYKSNRVWNNNHKKIN